MESGGDVRESSFLKEELALSEENTSRVLSEANMYGVLYCLLQLCTLSEEWKSRHLDSRNLILPHVPFLFDLVAKWFVFSLLNSSFPICTLCA